MTSKFAASSENKKVKSIWESLSTTTIAQLANTPFQRYVSNLIWAADVSVVSPSVWSACFVLLQKLPQIRVLKITNDWSLESIYSKTSVAATGTQTATSSFQRPLVDSNEIDFSRFTKIVLQNEGSKQENLNFLRHPASAKEAEAHRRLTTLHTALLHRCTSSNAY